MRDEWEEMKSCWRKEEAMMNVIKAIVWYHQQISHGKHDNWYLYENTFVCTDDWRPGVTHVMGREHRSSDFHFMEMVWEKLDWTNGERMERNECSTIVKIDLILMITFHYMKTLCSSFYSRSPHDFHKKSKYLHSFVQPKCKGFASLFSTSWD